MKLTQEQIDKYKNDFHFELSEKDLKKDWHFDKKRGFQTINSCRCINFETNDGCWLKIYFKDLTQEQVEKLIACQ